MDEEIQKEEEEPEEEGQEDKAEPAAETKDVRPKKSKTPTLDEAREIAKELKEQNDRKEELLAREEELAAKQAVGGTAEAGMQPPEKKEETAQEYKNRIMRGEV